MTMTSSPTLREIAARLRTAGTILVVSHLRPDGDALGSAIAAGLWLRGLGKDVRVWNEDGVVSKFCFLPGHELVEKPPVNKPHFDVVLALDTSVRDRLGNVLDGLPEPAELINIDHHVSNLGYGTMNYIDPAAPATGQIVYQLLSGENASITPEIAANLFIAISTDTGSFQYANTTASTFDAAAALVRSGADVAALSTSIYDSLPMRRFELLRSALEETRFTCDGRVATTILRLETVDRLELQAEDTEGIIDELRSVDSVEAAAFFEELPDGVVRVSARAKQNTVDVCKVCSEFGGGGHPLASGARVAGTIEGVRETFTKALCDEITGTH